MAHPKSNIRCDKGLIFSLHFFALLGLIATPLLIYTLSTYTTFTQITFWHTAPIHQHHFAPLHTRWHWPFPRKHSINHNLRMSFRKIIYHSINRILQIHTLAFKQSHTSRTLSLITHILTFFHIYTQVRTTSIWNHQYFIALSFYFSYETILIKAVPMLDR